jgi:hypothetical protein
LNSGKNEIEIQNNFCANQCWILAALLCRPTSGLRADSLDTWDSAIRFQAAIT